MTFIPIPDESAAPQFTTRKIRRAGETSLLAATMKLLARFEDEGGEMLVGEMSDLVDCLHRSAMLVQKEKQRQLIARLNRIEKKNQRKK